MSTRPTPTRALRPSSRGDLPLVGHDMKKGPDVFARPLSARMCPELLQGDGGAGLLELLLGGLGVVLRGGADLEKV